MKFHTLSEAEINNYMDYKLKKEKNNPNLSEMEYTRLQDDVDIDYVLSSSTLHKYSNMEYNNESTIPH